MKRLLFIATLFISSICYADNVQFITVTSKGVTTSIALSEHPTIYYKNNIMRISTSDKDIEFPVEDIEKYEFTATPSKIENVYANKTIEDGQAFFSSLEPGSKIILVNLKGETIYSTVVPDSGISTIDLNQFPNGVYIIKTLHHSFKIFKK